MAPLHLNHAVPKGTGIGNCVLPIKVCLMVYIAYSIEQCEGYIVGYNWYSLYVGVLLPNKTAVSDYNKSRYCQD